MKPRAKHQSVQKSYEQASLLYDLFWAKRKMASLHFGYWEDNTQRLDEALSLHKKKLAGFAQIPMKAKVLDMGCGVGGGAIFLAKECQAEVIGVNISSTQLQEAKRNVVKVGLENQISFIQADYLNTELPTNSFDVIWAVESFFHCEDKEAFLKEAFRLLKPNGKLVLADYFLSKLPKTSKHQKLLSTWFKGFHIPNLLHIDELESQVNTAGFSGYQYRNVSQNVMPSSRRLYQLGRLGTLTGYLVSWLPDGILEKLPFNIAHTKATVAQYKALKQGLWEYGFLYMDK